MTNSNAVIKNLTPHTLNILNADYSVKLMIQPENMPPLRVAESKMVINEINGVVVNKTVYGKCDALPAQEDGVYLVVSRMVIDAHPERNDLLCPCEIVRKDADGNYSSHPFAKGDIIGCLSLSI